jgi:hypothetical protein
MIEILNELTEIPFEVFKDKWEEKKPGLFFDWSKAEKEWFYMKEADRVMAFTALSRNHISLEFTHRPEEFLMQFNLPF